MPKQKDLKRLVRARMQKTGEAYTTARRRLIKNNVPPPRIDHAAVAGMSDDRVIASTGRSWADWVVVLDAKGATTMTHRDIARYVSSLGTPDWWSQMVTVGYERIRGLREKGQRRDGWYEANKSRTYALPVATLYQAFARAARRKAWLPVVVNVRTATPSKSMRLQWADGTIVALFFTAKGIGKSNVAVQHQKLPSRAAAEAMKTAWGGYLDALGAKLA